MEYAEFSVLTKSTIRRMYDRLPDTARDDFETLFYGGELRFAVDTLIGGLERLNISITPSERDTLARILRHLNEPESRLDNVNVTTPQSTEET